MPNPDEQINGMLPPPPPPPPLPDANWEKKELKKTTIEVDKTFDKFLDEVAIEFRKEFDSIIDIIIKNEKYEKKGPEEKKEIIDTISIQAGVLLKNIRDCIPEAIKSAKNPLNAERMEKMGAKSYGVKVDSLLKKLHSLNKVPKKSK